MAQVKYIEFKRLIRKTKKKGILNPDFANIFKICHLKEQDVM